MKKILTAAVVVTFFAIVPVIILCNKLNSPVKMRVNLDRV
jgi:hypothetical protein